jgi:hypothetical protein
MLLLPRQPGLRASTNARKKRPLQTLNERLSLAKLTSPIYDETADQQNVTSFTPVQSLRVKKTTVQATLGITVPCRNTFFCIHTGKIGITRRFTRTPKSTEFCDSFSSSQEGQFTSLDRFKWHLCLANWPNEPSFYPGNKWILWN